MTDSQTQTQPNYNYTSSSAQSTRHILDNTASSSSPASSSSTTLPQRPSHPPRKPSTNYAEADARARAAAAATHSSSADPTPPTAGENRLGKDSDSPDKDSMGPASPSASWRPRHGRKQSWSRQDFKREMQMSAVVGQGGGDGDGEGVKLTGGGFTEADGGAA